METNDPKYKHKPSEKHTLEEVLKSLQDLIRNDLVESPPTAGPEPAPAAARDTVSRDENTPVRREDFAPQSPGAGPVNLNAVMRSLKDLIGNELNVGDEPVPESSEPAATHEVYLATDDQLEEYIPEELGELGDELNIGDELVLPEPETPAAPVESPAPDTGIEPAPLAEAPPEDIAPLAEEIVMESLPDEMVPLDEALTLDEPLEIEPAPVPDISATPELPGEISPELLAEPEPEPAPPPAAPEIPPPVNAAAAPGLQQELLFEEPPPIELRMPPSPEIAPAPEPAAEPETTPPPVAEASLPTIEVEESSDAGDYFDVATLPTETTAAEPEAVIDFDVEISVEPENMPFPSETPPATPAEAAPVAEAGTETLPVAEPAEQKITLEIIDVPLDESANSWPSVDFDSLVTEPVSPEPATAPVNAEATAPEAAPPTLTAEPEPVAPSATVTAPPAAESPPGPVTEPETPEPVETAPVTPPVAESAPPAESPPVATEPAATSAPESPNLDDIPVLNEVVAPPAGSAPAKPPVASPAVPPPASDHARDVVVRAVARLNVEMRKTGGTGLDTKTILRLQQLIRQELEKGGKK